MIAQSTTHASLLARLSGGADAGAWPEFVDRYAELIRGFARRQNVQPADCDDILQDVLVSLNRSMPDLAYDPALGKFRSYLKTTVLHAIYRRSCQDAAGSPLRDADALSAAAASDTDVEAKWEAEWRQYHLRLAMKTVACEFNATDRMAFERYAIGGDDAGRVRRRVSASKSTTQPHDWAYASETLYAATPAFE